MGDGALCGVSAFVPAPPVAPVPSPAPMPPVHPPPPMEDEPVSKKLKSEDSLIPEEEFLRRNKVCASRALSPPGESRLGALFWFREGIFPALRQTCFCVFTAGSRLRSWFWK